MTSQTTSELIARLEKLTGPDREVDCCIRETVEGWKNIGGGWREWPDGRRERYDYGVALPYTASIDAALTLLPEGWCAGFEDAGRFDRGPNAERPVAWCWRYDSAFEPDHQNGDQGYRSDPDGDQACGATRAIALSIAALRARAQ